MALSADEQTELNSYGAPAQPGVSAIGKLGPGMDVNAGLSADEHAELAELNKKAPSRPPAITGAFPGADIERMKQSFANLQNRPQNPAFLQHPIDWAESHVGDVLPLAGMGAGALGGTAGAGLLGLPSGPGAIGAAYAGGVAGAGAGGALGEASRASIGRMLGVNQAAILPQAASEGANSAIGEAVGKPVGALVGRVGQNLYDAGIRPLIDQANRIGKTGVQDVLYKYGVMSPRNLLEKSQGIADKIENTVTTPIVNQVDKAGGMANVGTLLRPVEELKNKMAGIRSPGAQYTAGLAKDTIDEFGSMFGKSESAPLSLGELRQIKTTTGYKTPKIGMSPAQQQVDNALYRGGMDAENEAIEKYAGPEQVQKYREGMSDMGKLITTRQGQATAQNQAQRLAENLTAPTGTDYFAATLGNRGGLENPGGLLKSLGEKKLYDLVRLGVMPVGYGLKKASESPVVQRGISGAIQQFSPWTKMGNQGGSQ